MTDRADLASQAEILRSLHVPGSPVVLPNIWDAASARLVAGAGFPAVATSSGAVAAALGYEDDDSMPTDEAFGAVKRVSDSVSVPVTADMEAGYQLSAEEFIDRLLDAGAVGCNLEDTNHHGDGDLRDPHEHSDWLRSVKESAVAAGVNIVVNARIDVFLSTRERTRATFEDALARARLYLEAGADCLYPIRLSDAPLVKEFVEQVDAPVNIWAKGAPPLAELAGLGVARVSFAGDLMRRAYETLHHEITAIRSEPT